MSTSHKFSPDLKPDISHLASRIDEGMRGDQFALRKKLQAAKDQAALDALSAAIEASCRRRAQRLANLPKPIFPDELPISQKRADIAQLIAGHQVVVVAGETGSGKTTQLPKICLELGRGVAGFIGHTQPRRIAARSVAARIASELRSEPGRHVGYKVRFSDHTSGDGYIKLMTDGILLAELQSDRFLEQYDTLIIDEAHERSLNIDFLLGYLKTLLPKRPDLKVIITSATIDVERFSRHFDKAPVIEVSGRTYPVDIRYRPLVSGDEDSDDRDPLQAIIEAVDELSALDKHGDILVFLSGEREIRETAEALRKHHPPHTEILPLYARLGASEQNKVFQPAARRRIVLATNVAETSLTVPGIRYVVDPGTARISRYSYRTKVQRLPIENISQSSANQRAGRCGRVAAGVCIRLYSEDDFHNRPAYTEPEILRTNLAAVILQMAAARLGAIGDFPFIDPPDSRFVNDGYKLLHELGAMDERRKLTPLGRQLAKLPLDPRIARMLLAAREFGSLREVLIIASALSIPDPRERPADAQQKADEQHRAFADEQSDFLAFVNLWNAFEEQRKHLTVNKQRQYCRERYLSFLRLREWRDTHQQLKQLCGDMGFTVNEQPADYAQVHRALLAGLLGNIALRDEGTRYLGARNTEVFLHPGSGLFKRPAKWLMAAELVETTRLYARLAARIEPEWIEPLAGHLVKRTYLEPHWEKKPAQVSAYEQVSLYGLIVTPRRRINYGPVAPIEARQIFIRQALVEGDYASKAGFFRHNQLLREEIEALEAKGRRRDILVEEELIHRFYDERIPPGIYSGAQLDTWLKQEGRSDPRRLFLDKDYLMRHGADAVSAERFPDHLTINGVDLPLNYHFEPGSADDGVSVEVPLALLNQLMPEPFDWLVPGLLEEKVIALLKGLPKPLRRSFVPVPDYARAVLDSLTVKGESLADALTRELRRISGVEIPLDAWQPDKLPAHLRMHFRIRDAQNKVLASGRDLRALQSEQGQQAQRSFQAMPDSGLERTGITRWDFAGLPTTVERTHQGISVSAWPALVDEQGSVAIQLFDTEAKAQMAMTAGLRRLYMLELGQAVQYLRKEFVGRKALCLNYAPLGACADLVEELIECIVDRTFQTQDGSVRDEAAFRQRFETQRAQLIQNANQLAAQVDGILASYHRLRTRLQGSLPAAWSEAVKDIDAQLTALVYPGFVRGTPRDWLEHLPRYLKAAELRLDKLAQNPAAEATRRTQMRAVLQAYSQAVTANAHAPEVQQCRWWLEEYRVSLFAQELKTAVPVSVKRIQNLLASIKHVS